ncbi:uncharacterized protein LOC104582857 [Brachypodium distachyon]|uniref:Uncharacterized protein n=1 Tax=Brachypodium distachyon TaxID=15368 RepID=I1HR00_BRADI|nr:uncharacterized protein LOC104582857 [Brachypodium distachyon]KQK09490.1 hypothetical protein BRADI_2g48290v3 [Brachypodium distachyon]|eukprot:XP_010232243.1 uncharacterized protein LOC104582857 [Brachypodium distachyon]
MRTQALVLAYLLAAALLHSLPRQSAAASPVSTAGKLVVGGTELRLPMIEKFSRSMTANQSTVQQLFLQTSSDDGIGHCRHPNWFSLLLEMTSPFARDHPFVDQEIGLDHLLVLTAAFVVYLFR